MPMRVIAGEFRSRPLLAPAGMDTRPTSDRLRETLFNVLAPRIEGASFLDLYAGSGAVGIEALSRGASGVVFVEKATAALKMLRENLARLGLAKGVQVDGSAVGAWLKRGAEGQAFDLVFLDPPYEAAQEYGGTLGALGGAARTLLREGAMVIAEHRRKDELEESYGVLRRTRVLKQGDAALSWYAIGMGTTDGQDWGRRP